jgi:hypothetical protein
MGGEKMKGTHIACQKRIRRVRGPYITHHNIRIKQTDPTIPRSEDKEYTMKYRKEYHRIRKKEEGNTRSLIILGEEKFSIKREKIVITFE